MNRFHVPLKWSLIILVCYTIVISVIIVKTITKDVSADTADNTSSDVPTLHELL